MLITRFRASLRKEHQATVERYKRDQSHGQDEELPCALPQCVPQRKQSLEVPGYLEDPDDSESSEKAEDHDEGRVEMVSHEFQVEGDDG